MSGPTFERLLRRQFPFGFATALEAGRRFDLLPILAAADPDLTRENVQAVRRLAHTVNQKKAAGTYHPEPIRAEQLFALGLIVDALRYVTLDHCRNENPGVLERGRRRAVASLGEPSVEGVPLAFVRLYPPRDLVPDVPPPGAPETAYERRTAEHLRASTEGMSNRDLADVETVLLYLVVRNPATKALRDLFDDADLQLRAAYVPYVVGLEEFFDDQPALGRFGRSLFDVLRAPMRAAPHSLEDQLRYIRDHWSDFLPRHILDRMTLALDIWEEDRRMRGLGPGPMPVLEFGRNLFGGEPEFEAFTEDRDWMSNLVLMAKNVHVWLDQLSKRYGRHLHRLSDIPDEELDRLARWGFRGLWLIGLWERSHASRKIKQYMGNPEAVASAYSLADYRIADDLGGEEAWRDLRDRAWLRGIRLASDMVPNHMGIDSRWVIEHPHWFVQSEQSPYPWYTFGGGDLSEDPRVTIQIEDGYWERRDAAVVFRRIDRRTGEARFIYHGNDGTSMPWNDTAQLNFLLHEVREAVIRTILHVARLFPIIRFDAAMTLAKKHYQRLWFPQPGDAGAIPSRAEQGMSKEEFDAAFPAEFWREVVDRMAAEAPDTLLLAEAFWLMEGYFVRTLGMHRVYNSAFMNMLKMEENQKYRQTVKNVLEFSPEVLKRFVNFMNNPDERTAVEQFGKGDKYFGVCVLMVTMPGLPMFGHGQIEGFAEKYGMEYCRAYWDEPIDEGMIRRHEEEIFPLMRRRALFSGAGNFALYDFVRGDGSVNENVFAYSNRAGGERGVILYNNAYESTSGTIRTSTSVNVGNADAPSLERRSLAQALGVDPSDGCYYSFRDHKERVEYLRSGREIAENGLFAHVGGYQWHAFLDWREHRDGDGRWGALAARLGGRPVPSVETAMREWELRALLEPFGAVVRAAVLLASNRSGREERERFAEALAPFLAAAADLAGVERGTVSRVAALEAAVDLKSLLGPRTAARNVKAAPAGDEGGLRVSLVALAVSVAGRMGIPDDEDELRRRTAGRADEWLLCRAAARSLGESAIDEESARSEAAMACISAAWGRKLAPGRVAGPGVLEGFFSDRAVAAFLGVHEHEGVRWYNKERLEALTRAVAAVARLESKGAKGARETIAKNVAAVLGAAEEAGYRVDQTEKLFTSLTFAAVTPPAPTRGRNASKPRRNT